MKWSRDGSTLLTGGEDGEVKIWSKSGNLRTTLASTGQTVYCACWGPDDDQILIGNGKTLMIKTVQANRKNLQWNAHDGIVLCVDWNVANGLIISGGEDCIYRIWDAFGRQLYSSRAMEHVVTALGWSPNGETFAVGSHDLIRLCDKTGWTHCRERIQSGSVLCIAWTPDGTQFAGAGGNGSVIFAQVVDRRLEWKNTEVTLIGPRKLHFQDVASESAQDIEFSRDRIVEIGLGFNWLVVTTTTQCSVYSIHNLNTPIIFDIKAPPHFLQLCQRHFLSLDQISGLQIISYEGRVVSTPRFQGLRSEYLTKEMVSLSPDTIAIIDTVDNKCIHILDASSSRAIGKLVHGVEVVEVTLNQFTITQERLLAFADKNKDFYIAQCITSPAVAGAASTFPVHKLLTHVESFLFNDETDVLVALADGRLHVWYYPAVPFVDKDLLPLTTTTSDVSEFGRNARIIAYTGCKVAIRKSDGATYFFATPTDVDLLYQLVRGSKWDESLRLCRHQRSQPLWASLACMSLLKKQLEIVEICLAEVNEVAKVCNFQVYKSNK